MKNTLNAFVLFAALCSFAHAGNGGGDDDNMIEVSNDNADGKVVQLLLPQAELPQVVKDKLEAGEPVTLVFDKDDPVAPIKKDKAQNIIGISLGLGAPMGGQVGITYSPPVTDPKGKNLFEVSGAIGSAIVLTSAELGVNIRVPYVHFLYAHIGYQYVQSSRFLEYKASSLANKEIQDQVNQIQDPQARGYVQNMKLGYEPSDFHFAMSGASLGVGVWLGPLRLEAGVNTMHVKDTANSMYDHLTGKLAGEIDAQKPAPPQDPHSLNPFEEQQYHDQLDAYNQGVAEYNSKKDAAIQDGRNAMNSGIDKFFARTPGGLMPYVKLTFVIPIVRH